jgi:hypothetical protein
MVASQYAGESAASRGSKAKVSRSHQQFDRLLHGVQLKELLTLTFTTCPLSSTTTLGPDTCRVVPLTKYGSAYLKDWAAYTPVHPHPHPSLAPFFALSSPIPCD